MTNGYVPIDEVAGQGKSYRLWRKPPITQGNPNIILVHGAIAPFFGELHDPNTMNNNRFGFYDLDSLLYEDFHYNVFTFEYADESVGELGYVNYNRLDIYGDRLIDAIRIAKEKSKKPDGTVGPVTVIAFSMGGLIARYAAKCMPGTVNKIITLETGHFGFQLANFIEKLWHLAGMSQPALTYDQDVEEGSAFINKLNEGFDAYNPRLVSLAAGDPVPLPLPPPANSIWVAAWHSSSMGQIDDKGNPTPSDYNIPFCKLPNYNHATISRITNSSHPVYQKIKEYLG